MTRCVYFQIEGEDSLNPWFLGRDNVQIPFLMVGLAGIIMSPLDGSGEFTNPAQIEELLNFIENRVVGLGEAELNVELADIWLPNSLLHTSDRSASRGNVFRVGHRLLHVAIAFRDGRLALEEFLHIAHDLPDDVAFAQRETAIFERWAQIETERASERRNPNLWLPKKNA